MKFNGTTWEYVDPPCFSGGEGEGAFDTALAFSPNGEPYVVYRDGINLNKATLMKFDGTSWVNVGPAEGITPGMGAFF